MDTMITNPSGKGKTISNDMWIFSTSMTQDAEDPCETWRYFFHADGTREPKGKGKTMSKGNLRWRKEN